MINRRFMTGSSEGSDLLVIVSDEGVDVVLELINGLGGPALSDFPLRTKNQIST
jgi:hypothetical protein